jgi:hypothetical protein
MESVKIRTKEGRKAFIDAACKQEIPHDRFIPVTVTSHIRRLIDVHEDVEVEPEIDAAAVEAEAVEVKPAAPLTGLAAIQAAQNHS